jgi:enoyl-CoA hydratase/carnithine racemase
VHLSDEELVLLERRDTSAIATFNRPEKRNALSTPLLLRFARVLDEVEADPSVRALVLTGAGPKAFVAGADIAEYAEQDDAAFEAYQRRSRELFDRLDAFATPVIAAVNGYALGGGFEIALACDVIVASDAAQFGLPEGRLGLSPGGGGTQRLTRAGGPYVAADVLLFGARLSAERAHQLGVVAEVCALERLPEVAAARAAEAAALGPLAVREMGRLVAHALDDPLVDGLAAEHEALLRLRRTRDAEEGVRAFVEKRPPRFEGA